MILIAASVIIVPCYVILTSIKELVDIIVFKSRLKIEYFTIALEGTISRYINCNQTVRTIASLLCIELSILILTSLIATRDIT
jgi:hypothetical protein